MRSARVSPPISSGLSLFSLLKSSPLPVSVAVSPLSLPVSVEIREKAKPSSTLGLNWGSAGLDLGPPDLDWGPAGLDWRPPCVIGGDGGVFFRADAEEGFVGMMRGRESSDSSDSAPWSTSVTLFGSSPTLSTTAVPQHSVIVVHIHTQLDTINNNNRTRTFSDTVATRTYTL